MKILTPLRSLLIVVSASLLAHVQAADNSVHSLVGAIDGKNNLRMILTIEDGQATGAYYYLSTRLPLSLDGTLKPGGKLALEERDTFHRTENDPDGPVTGKFSATLSADGNITGNWTSAKSGKKLPFALAPDPDAVSLVLQTAAIHDPQGKTADGREYGHDITLSWLEAPKNPALSNALRRHLYASAVGYLPRYSGESSAKPATPKNVSADDLRALAKEFAAEKMTPDEGYPHSLDAHARPTFNQDGILAVAVEIFTYSGGAHGFYETRHLVLDPASATPVTLASALLPGYRPALRAAAEKNLGPALHLPPGTPASEGMLVDKFELNDNWTVRPDGLLFSFAPYEIASYAQGQIDVPVPFVSIVKLLRPSGPFAWAIPAK